MGSAPFKSRDRVGWRLKSLSGSELLFETNVVLNQLLNQGGLASCMKTALQIATRLPLPLPSKKGTSSNALKAFA